MKQEKSFDKAAKDLAALLEKHFDSLSPQEREEKSAAFQEVVAKVGTRAKSVEPPGTQGSRRSAGRPE